MAQKTKKKGNWLIWAVWIAAALCLTMTVLLALIVGHHAGLLWRQEAPTEAAPTDTVTEAPTEEETQEPTEETYPILDLEPNPYTAEDFGYVGRYMSCLEGPCMMGIDVSFWQDEVNWPLVKAAGMEFTMIRLAYRGSTEGVIEEDSWARTNYRGAKDAGMLVGGYFFSQALTPEEAIEEADFVLAMAEEMVFDMPIVFDWEQTWGRTSGMDPRTLTECAKAFCQRIEEGGLEAMVYFGVYQAHYGLYVEELTDYKFWLAMYDSEMDFPYKVDMWQYTDSGSVPGIYGAVDLNIYFEYDEEETPADERS